MKPTQITHSQGYTSCSNLHNDQVEIIEPFVLELKKERDRSRKQLENPFNPRETAWKYCLVLQHDAARYKGWHLTTYMH